MAVKLGDSCTLFAQVTHPLLSLMDVVILVFFSTDGNMIFLAPIKNRQLKFLVNIPINMEHN